VNRAEREAILDAARRYVAAWHAVQGSDSREFSATASDYADAFHTLLVAVDERARYATPVRARSRPIVVDVIDPAGRL
jgi:hypothetical protein